MNTTIKFKFKIEFMNEILKNKKSLSNVGYQNTYDNKLMDIKSSQSKKIISTKKSERNSKVQLFDNETLPGYEKEMSKLTLEEKDEILNLLKVIEQTKINSIFTLINNKQFYNNLKTKNGLEILRNAFKEIMKIKSEFSNNCSKELNINNYFDNLQETQFINDEYELFFYLKDILNITEFDSMEIFDLFKFNEFFAIGEKHFIILIYLLAAYDSGQMEDFINLFYEDLFKMISGSQEMISLSRLNDLGRILNIDEKFLNRISTEMSLDFNTAIDLTNFKMFYTNLAKFYDDEIKKKNLIINKVGINTNDRKMSLQGNLKMSQSTNLTATNSPIKGQEQSIKVKTGNCFSKACNIL